MKNTPACPLPSPRRFVSLSEAWAIFSTLGQTYWLKALAVGAVAAVVIGLPTQLIPNPFFMRMIPTTWLDYAIFGVSIALLGLTWALPQGSSKKSATERNSLLGGFVTLFAVGCPTCNKLVLLLLGSGGALTYFAPIQPLLGLGAIVMMIVALHRRLGQLAPRTV